VRSDADPPAFRGGFWSSDSATEIRGTMRADRASRLRRPTCVIRSFDGAPTARQGWRFRGGSPAGASSGGIRTASPGTARPARRSSPITSPALRRPAQKASSTRRCATFNPPPPPVVESGRALIGLTLPPIGLLFVGSGLGSSSGWTDTCEGDLQENVDDGAGELARTRNGDPGSRAARPTSSTCYRRDRPSIDLVAVE
jgi:hypothetical protein